MDREIVEIIEVFADDAKLEAVGKLLVRVLNGQKKILKELKAMSVEQDKIDADVAAVKAVTDGLTTADANIQAEIAALKAANPDLDLSGLDAAVAPLQGIASDIEGIAPAPVPAT